MRNMKNREQRAQRKKHRAQTEANEGWRSRGDQALIPTPLAFCTFPFALLTLKSPTHCVETFNHSTDTAHAESAHSPSALTEGGTSAVKPGALASSLARSDFCRVDQHRVL
jgi:hypothetical protein